MINIDPCDRFRAKAGSTYGDFEINVTPVERILKRTPLVGAGEYRCSPDHPQFAGGGPEKCPFIVFSYSSVRLIPSRGRPEVCTPNTVNLLDVGDSYERRPVSKEGVTADWIALSPGLLKEIARDVDPTSEDTGQSIFERTVAPISPKIFLAQKAFFNSVQHDPSVSQLAIEESAMRLVALVLEETKKPLRPKRFNETKPHRSAAARRREMVEETKCILAREYWNNISMAQLAERVHCSPGYLSRSFTSLSGFTLHHYQQQLRLRAALQLIAEARYNCAGIAAQLGFANHSHLTDVFRRQFGTTPKSFAHLMRQASFESVSALLDAVTLHSSHWTQVVSDDRIFHPEQEEKTLLH